MLESWVEAGQDPALFWHLTPREIGHILKGAARRIEREKLFLDAAAWGNAHLTGFAVHDPKKMPGFEKFRGGAKSGPDHAPLRDWRAMKVALFGFNAALGGGVIRS